MKAVFVDLQTTGPRDPLRDERSGKTDALADSAHTRSDVWSVSDRRRSSHRGFVFSVGTHLWVSSCTTPHTPLASTEAARRPPPPQTPPRRAQKAAGQRGLTAASCALATAAPAGRGTSSATAARCSVQERAPDAGEAPLHSPHTTASCELAAQRVDLGLQLLCRRLPGPLQVLLRFYLHASDIQYTTIS